MFQFLLDWREFPPASHLSLIAITGLQKDSDAGSMPSNYKTLLAVHTPSVCSLDLLFMLIVCFCPCWSRFVELSHSVALLLLVFMWLDFLAIPFASIFLLINVPIASGLYLFCVFLALWCQRPLLVICLFFGAFQCHFLIRVYIWGIPPLFGSNPNRASHSMCFKGISFTSHMGFVHMRCHICLYHKKYIKKKIWHNKTIQIGDHIGQQSERSL